MKEYRISFLDENVQAIQQDRKTQTRRPLKFALPEDAHQVNLFHAPHLSADVKAEEGIYYWSKPGIRRIPELPYGLPGDHLWVRETFMPLTLGYAYKADKVFIGGHPAVKWKSSRYMPRKAARIILEVTNVRVERLNSISQADAKAEGIDSDWDGTSYWYKNYLKQGPTMFKRDAVASYQSLWDFINGKDAWEKNPWVWVIEFKKV